MTTTNGLDEDIITEQMLELTSNDHFSFIEIRKIIDSCNPKLLYIDILRHLSSSASIIQFHNLVLLLQQAILQVSMTKRLHFLEDSFASVLSYQDEQHSVELLRIKIDYIHPFIAAMTEKYNTKMHENEIIPQKKAFVFFLLKVFSCAEFSKAKNCIRGDLLDVGQLLMGEIRLSGIEMQHIFLSWHRNCEIVKFKSMLLPHDDAEDYESDGSDYDKQDVEDPNMPAHLLVEVEEEIAKIDSEIEQYYPDQFQMRWLGTSVIPWDYNGIKNLLYWASVQESENSFVPSILSPSRILYLTYPYIEMLLNHESIQDKKRGLDILASISSKVGMDPDLAMSQVYEIPPFVEGINKFEESQISLNWISSLFQSISSTMVSYPDEMDRNRTHEILQHLLSAIDPIRRLKFELLEYLIHSCPFSNVRSILIDRLRRDTFENWRMDIDSSAYNPYDSPAIVKFLRSILKSISDEDLLECMDVYVSSLSLYRFVLLRDKKNCTGIRSSECIKHYKHLLASLHRRILELSSVDNNSNIKAEKLSSNIVSINILNSGSKDLNSHKQKSSCVKTTLLTLEAAIEAVLHDLDAISA